MASLKLVQFVGLVNVTGEFTRKAVETVITPAHRVLAWKEKKGKCASTLTPKNVPEKVKHVTVKVPEYVTIQFPAGEAFVTATRVGAAFELACRMLADGATSVILWDYSGNELKIGKADVTRCRKALEAASRCCKALEADETPLAA